MGLAKGNRVTRSAGLVALILLASLSVWAEDKKSEVDEIGNRKVAHRSVISQDKEIAIGKQYAQQIDKSAKLVTDPVITEYVNRVAQNVARNSDLKIPLTVKVINDPSINAFTLPGGFLYVNSGVLKAATEEDQLAGVLAHEIGHAAARHWASQMTKASILQYATLPLIFVPLSYPVYLGVSSAFNFGVPVAFLKFSRTDEAEADYLGLQYMYKAGYDPNSYVTFFGKVLEDERRQPGSVANVFADHPPTADRIVKALEEIKKLPSRDQYLVSTSEFDEVKGRLSTVVASLKQKDKSAPSLERRADKPAAGSPSQKGDGQGDDQPPVLRRRDGLQAL